MLVLAVGYLVFAFSIVMTWHVPSWARIAIAGIAMEIGIEPTARHVADLGFIPVIIADACGTGHEDAAKRSLDSLAFAGDSLITDTSEFCRLLRAKH
jgi:biuret amidohydrolase